ncbi:MAG TPA: DNA mismatch repair protein MutS, partial [Polyangiales bacterium]|nr:DNA mismatch repair protein MutS [Polyangiales bacterium]
QMEDPSKVKGVVPREVVRVITPALALEADAFDARRPSYLAVIVPSHDEFGFAVLELGAAEVRATSIASEPELLAELARTEPREVLLFGQHDALAQTIARLLPRMAARSIDAETLARAKREPQIEAVLAGQGETSSESACDAVRLALCYALDAQPGTPLDVQRLLAYDASHQLSLDDAAVRNLELVSTLAGERKGSLLHMLDATKTSMGARALRRRVLAPLAQLDPIRRRHDAVQWLVEDAELRARVRSELAHVHDIERLATRASLGIANPRDLAAIGSSLAYAATIARLLAERSAHSVDDVLERLLPDDPCDDVQQLLAAALVEEPPLVSTQAGIFRAEHDVRIAELRELSTASKDVILRLEERERARTGISSLKIRYTKVFGYYMEISRAKAQSVPADYRRKQTVASGERFTTEELETIQAKILNADERLRALEQELFATLRKTIGTHAARLRRLAARLADLDVHAALADVAHRQNYVRPEVDESLELALEEARHPVVETMLPRGSFVPNDVTLNADDERMMVITGPNMAGKSTTMRQVALATILAQAGSFVPAARARIGLCDRIFTRVGASDNLVAGQSTFMVEMRETANILRGATRRSLVILDEIGRGTSTYDGLSIAWAVAEYLNDVVQCRAMFATHYHELCDLAEVRKSVVNYNVAAREHGEDVVFLHRLIAGPANRSYGIAVAKLSGIPEIVLARARAILRELETHAGGVGQLPAWRTDERASSQLSMFAPLAAEVPASACEATLRELDLDRMTPLDALNALSRLKALLPPLG